MKIRRRVVIRIASGMATLLLVVGSLGIFTASGASVSNRGVSLSDVTASATSSYRFFFTGVSTGTIGSIRLQLCSNDPFPETPCTAPSGLDFTGATLIAQGGMTGFTVDPSSTANDILLTRVASPGLTTPSFYEFDGVINPDTAGSLYGRITTHSSTDGTGGAVDYGGLATYIGPSALTIETEVPPYLLFCVGISITGRDCTTATGDYIDFGTLSSNYTVSGRTQIVVASNAASGFIVSVKGTTMTSGINTIQQLSTPDISRVGVSQFGMNLRANSTPPGGLDPTGYGLSAVVTAKYNQPNYYAFTSGDTIVQATKPDSAKYMASYIANVSKNQAPGTYVSTLQYVAVASF